MIDTQTIAAQIIFFLESNKLLNTDKINRKEKVCNFDTLQRKLTDILDIVETNIRQQNALLRIVESNPFENK